MARAPPGKMVIHHSPDGRNCGPVLIRVPSDGWVGGRPTPRKLSVASVITASARLMVAITSTGPITLGSTWRIENSGQGSQITREACNYSLFFPPSTEPRPVRAYCPQYPHQIGRASGRGRVCQYGSYTVIDVTLTTKKN